ncbi:MAG TPA: RnfABCDGE type electron transport complex subunit B [Steroidobacteraceae bacterium]|jgi:electron transport complex protein RnfB|nr:RnfABCDGE type electron transport complex subunit B [Steroidobacteraceae bacterium]
MMNSESAPDIASRIDALLPQTQCTRCGYAGCKPYAAAIASGEAQINQCPPGGHATIAALAKLTGRPVQALNPVNGVESPPRVAWIDESRCIGCARCLAPCPVDAIVGAAKYMHTVLAERCTGCELCLPPCPVDCIDLKASPSPAANQPALNRKRFDAHTARLLNRAAERQREIDAKKAAALRRSVES